MSIIRSTTTYMTPAKADALAAHLNADEAAEGWTYRAVHDPIAEQVGKGSFSFIEVTDDEGIIVGKL